MGIAWAVRGNWRGASQNAAIRTGDTIRPGILLQPGGNEPAHSITILLPDGQRILYECFTAKACARGFRVPGLETDPSPFAIRLLEQIHAVLVQQRTQPQLDLATHSPAGRDEAAADLEAGDRVEIAGLAATLSNGRYIYDLTPIDSRYPPLSNVAFQKSGHSISLAVPGPGLYRLKIVDSLGNPRIDDLIAAVRPDDPAGIVHKFHEAHAQFKEWIEDFQGWPVHDFQRAYLESLMLNIRPAANRIRITPVHASVRPGVTAEPVFSPKPGVSNGNMGVDLSCATPGAAIHYTVDGSQPLAASPVYHAPIIMKRLPMMIKAFAESPGEKDSPVVTGIFRVANHD